MYDYRKAKLNDKRGDLSSRWYIEFSAFDVQKNALKRKFDYTVNSYKTVEERKNYSRQRIKLINKLLTEGFHFDKTIKPEEEKPTEVKYMNIKEALWFALDIKKKDISHGSYNSYSSDINLFVEYLNENNYHDILLDQFTKNDAIKYADFLSIKGYTGKTINKKISYLSAFFTFFVKREYISENVFKKVEKKKEVLTRQNFAYNDKQIASLKSIIGKKDQELWRFCSIMYYTFLRVNEIRLLQVYNIDLKQKLIYLDAFKSKNKKERYVEISDSLISVLEELTNNKTSKEYLFGSNKPIGKNTMTNRHKNFLIQIKAPSEYTLYSWKHTGVVKSFLAGIDMKYIQQQCGHTTMAMTDNYLKSLGLIRNRALANKIPTI